MPSFCGLENDVFISYAHADNTEGWVDKFHERLFNRLRELDRNAPFLIWRDRKLAGSDIFTDEINRQLKSSGILLSVLSPNGLESDWCQQERERFQRAANGNGGSRLGTKARSIRVTKAPCPGDRDRQLFGTLGFDFYRRSPQSNRFTELHPTSAEFSALVLDIAQDIYELLQLLRKRVLAPPPDISVYVAGVSSDLQPWRERVVNQLTAWNCRVLPETADVDQLSTAMIKQSLEGCAFSVHWAGLEDPLLVDMLQLNCARTAPIERIICEVQEPPAALQAILNSRSPQGHEERIRSGTPDELLQYLEDRIGSLRKTPSRDPGNLPLVYVVCSPAELDYALRLKQCLEAERRFAALLPIRDVEDENLRLRDHRASLKSCQAVLIYWGASTSPAWFRDQQRELFGARGKRKNKPLPALCLTSSPQANPAADSLPGLPIQQIASLDCASVKHYFGLLAIPANGAHA